MNRSERRRRMKEGLPITREPVVNMKRSDIEAIKEKSTQDASRTAFTLLLAIPAMVLHKNYGKLMRREIDGIKRVERFTDMCIELYERFDRGEVTIEELTDCLYKEAGIKIKD